MSSAPRQKTSRSSRRRAARPDAAYWRALGGDAPCGPALVGRKAAALNALTRGGAPTPPAIALTVAGAEAVAEGGADAVGWRDAVAWLEDAAGRRLGDVDAPLLLSVRLSPETPVTDLAHAALGVGAPLGAPAMTPGAARVERLFWRSWGPLAAGVEPEDLDEAVDPEAVDLEDPIAVAAALRRAALTRLAEPPSPERQVAGAIEGLVAAWRAPRARRRRAVLLASDACGLILQAHASDLSGPPEACGGGSAALHDAETGMFAPWTTFSAGLLGDPRLTLSAAARRAPTEALADAIERTEIVLGGPQEVDFALDDGRPYIMAARPLRASAAAAIRIAVRRAEAGAISRADAVRQIPAARLEALLHRSIAPDAPRDRIAKGLSASPGAATGRLAFSVWDVEAFVAEGEAAVLVRDETGPEDVQAMNAAAGVLTTRGGLTSHAAVVARGLGTPCVVGASDIRLDAEDESLTTADGRVLHLGDPITIDGSAGEALAGAAPLREPEPSGDFATLMRWADSFRRLRVRANADTTGEAETARRLGVDGIGLCRTEHMFFDRTRIVAMQEMILADRAGDRWNALAKLLPMQRADFSQLFEIMADADAALPVTIRLLDPPLNEFLPQTPRGLRELADALGQPVDKVSRRAAELVEHNPMLGKRGCRMGVAYPEIYEMQARAIFEAAVEVTARTGVRPRPEIMIPLVSAVRELEVLRSKIDDIAAQVRHERRVEIDYRIGIMVETPRAALRAHALGAISSFFSFGTNDLTQMTYGLSRDDAGRLMRDYIDRGVFEADPFQSLDVDGVGELMRLGVERGRSTNPDLAIGLCGEHGGDPATIAFCAHAGFDYVSCSPFRTPIARLAAAQAALAEDAAATDGGATDGGATDGGATDDGATDGGATDGGATDDGATP